MDDGKKRRRDENCGAPGAIAQEHGKNESAEQQLFENRDEDHRTQNGWHFAPKKRVTQRVDMESDQDRAAAEQGDGGDREPRAEARSRMLVLLQPEIAPAPHAKRSEEWPEED